MKRVIVILIVAALAVAGYFAFQRVQQRQQQAALSDLQTVPAERGSLTATVGATGMVRANQTALLVWQTSGSVAEVSVAVGDRVEAGQVLAALHQSSLAQNIILAQAELVEARKALDALYNTDLTLAQAEQTLAQARDLLEDQQYRMDSLGKPAREVDIESAEAAVLVAKVQLDRAWDQYRPFQKKSDTNPVRASLFQKYTQAKQLYDAAVRRLNNLQGQASELTLSVAQADLDLAEAQVAAAQETVNRLKAGPDPDDVAAAQARIAAAQAALDLTSLVAPFAGAVTEAPLKAGDQVTPGTTAFRLDDLSHLLVDVQVSEVDINRIRLGQEVALTFDAILNREYHGRVTQVAPVGTSTQGVVDFAVAVELTDADEAVRPGMTAAVNVVVSQLEDVLLAPNRAVRVRDGQRVVYVLLDGALQPVDVTLGASSESMSEVVAGGLKEGDRIVLNPPNEFEQGGPPPFVR